MDVRHVNYFLEVTRTVRIIPETVPEIPWNLALIWNKNQYLSHAARGWIRFIKDRV